MNTYYTTGTATFQINNTTNGWYTIGNKQWTWTTKTTYADNESAVHLLREHDPYESDYERSQRVLKEGRYIA